MPGEKKNKLVVVKNENQVAPMGESKNLAETLISQAIEKNVPIETMERLLAMRRELKEEYAKSQFDKAMAIFQSECPTIGKNKKVMNKDGKSARYHYAPLNKIVEEVQPLFKSNGLSYIFEVKNEADAIEVTCVANHIDGFSKGSSFRAPIDPESFMNKPQRYASALTFAKRYSFCDVFGIVTGDEDDDAAKVGEAEKEEKTFATILKAINDATLKELEDLKPKMEKSDKYSETQKKMLLGNISARIFNLKQAEESK